MQVTLDLLKTLLDTTQDGIVICDQNGTLQYFNGITRQMHGLPQEDLPAEQWAGHYSLYHADGLTLLQMQEVPLFRALKGEQIKGQDMVIQPRAGRKIHVSCSGQQILNAQGEVIGAMVVMRDLTREKDIQWALEQSQQVAQLQEALHLASERALKQRQILQHITQRLLALQNPQQMAQVILQEGRPLLDLQTVSIFLRQDNHSQLLVTSKEGVNPEVIEELGRIPLKVTVSHPEIAPLTQPLFYPQVQVLQSQHPEFSWLGNHLQNAALAFLPIRMGDQVLGTLLLQLRETPEFREDEQAFMQNLADQVALALERFRLHERDQHLTREREDSLSILQAVLDHAPMGIALRDTNLKFQLVNPMYWQHSQRPIPAHPEEGMRQMDAQLTEPVLGYLQRVLNTGESLLNVDFHLPGRAGATQDRDWLLNYFPVKTPAGQLLGVGSIIQDVSARKQAERALEASQHFLQRMADTTPTILYLSDAQTGQISYANQHLQETLGYTPGQVMQMTLQDFMTLLHPADLEVLTGSSQKIHRLQDGEVQEREFRILHKDGSWKWLYSRQTVFSRDAKGQPALLLTGAVDITRRKDVEQQLKQSENELREANAAQKRFVADAAHELRNPLTSIQGNMDLMVRYKNLPEEDRMEMVQDVQKEAGRLGRLVHDMLLLAKGDAGGEIRDDDVDLQALALSAFREMERQRPGHTFLLGEMDQVELVGDQDKLRQLLIILIDNAAKYTPPGGTVQLSLKTQQGQAELHIADSGIGMAPEDLSKVFERFYRVDQSRNKHGDPGGTGLGLPIARWVVEQHGGKIWFESELGRGTTAVVQLPLLS